VKREALLIIFLFYILNSMEGQSLNVVTNDEPPMNYLNMNGQLTGFASDFVEEIKQRLGNKDPIQVLPWSRITNKFFTEPNTVIFTVARMEEREDLFHWISIIDRNAWVLLTKRDSEIEIDPESDLNDLGSIAVLRDDGRDRLLRSLNIENIETVSSWSQAVRMLSSGRVPLILYAASSFANTCKDIGYDFHDFKVVQVVKKIDAYIVMSKETDLEVVRRWQETAAEIKADGTYERIMEEWIDKIEDDYGLECFLKDGILHLWDEDSRVYSGD